MKFTGDDSEIDLNISHPEFKDWAWVDQKTLLRKNVSFKAKTYQEVCKRFLNADL